ncbi:MAG: glycosyltransferase family 2 protein [Candidatus Omnitrophica bacterium]|nr:glycosyltransferase family 2 protein [Candidatus Omnitrophota bacterium]
MEITDTLDIAARREKKVYPFFLDGEYVNVNNLDDLNLANYILRSQHFDKRKLSLVIPAYNEAESIGYVIDDFKNKVDEIIVADNNSVDDTAKLAKERGATVYTRAFKGYGDALRFGMEKASGDILVLTEADGSFRSRDLNKMLEYIKDADMVIGTRTTKQMVEQAANMSFLLRWGNVIAAKFLELLWLRTDQPRLTDLGCTYRAIWKKAYSKIKNSLKANGPEFSPEMMIEVMNFDMRMIEIPITYGGRLGGASKFSRGLFGSIKTGMRMLKLIIYKKLRRVLWYSYRRVRKLKLMIHKRLSKNY